MHLQVYPAIVSVHDPCVQGLEWQNEFWAETEKFEPFITLVNLYVDLVVFRRIAGTA